MAELTSNTNYLQPTGFAVTISREQYPNLQYFCQSVQHPGIDVASVEMPFRRVNVPFPGDKLEFGLVGFTFLLDEDLEGYLEMYRWLRRLVEDDYTTSSKSLLSTDGTTNDASAFTEIPTEADITVSILNSYNNVSKQIKYYSAFPTSISTIELSSLRSDPEPITFESSFRFAYFEIL